MSILSSILALFGRKSAPTGPKERIEIYVGNLSYEMTDEQLEKAFAKFGTVRRARVITNRFNNKSKGFGFVEMTYRSEAEKAIKALNEKTVMGRKLRVNEARNGKPPRRNGNHRSRKPASTTPAEA